MQVIGFTNVYYTLWSVSKPYKHYFDQYSWEWRIDKNFVQNLSLKFEEAKAKVEGEYEIDLGLRGESYQWVSVGDGQRYSDFPVWLFPWGKAKDEDITQSENIWQLERFYKIGLEAASSMMNERRRGVFCRQRLIELGALTRIDWVEYIREDVNWGKRDSNGNNLVEDRQDVPHKRKYATAYDMRGIERKRVQDKLISSSTHHYNEGDKVVLELKEVSRGGYDTMYGYNYIVTYEDVEGRIFKYIGTSPLEVIEDCKKVKGTIKHSEYNGVKETRLQRIKLV